MSFLPMGNEVTQKSQCSTRTSMSFMSCYCHCMSEPRHKHFNAQFSPVLTMQMTNKCLLPLALVNLVMPE